jgi:hypothetical protein
MTTADLARDGMLTVTTNHRTGSARLTERGNWFARTLLCDGNGLCDRPRPRGVLRPSGPSTRKPLHRKGSGGCARNQRLTAATVFSGTWALHGPRISLNSAETAQRTSANVAILLPALRRVLRLFGAVRSEDQPSSADAARSRSERVNMPAMLDDVRILQAAAAPRERLAAEADVAALRAAEGHDLAPLLGFVRS